jgi:hypothetical protein
MPHATLLDLLGTGKLPPQMERKFIQFCVWQQARPAFIQVLQAAGLSNYAKEADAMADLPSMVECARLAAETAHRSRLPVLAMGAVQGMSAEIAQLAAAADPAEFDAEAVSFHAARLVGWATWASNKFGTGVFKASAEAAAYGEQLQALMSLLSAPG